MDPATAIGVASSVLAFLDFSIKVVNGAVKIYRSADGTTSEYVHLEIVAQDMKARTESMKHHRAAKTPEEQNIVKLAEECHKLSDQMLILLKETKVKGGKHSKLGSLQAAYQVRRKRKEVAELQSLIQEYCAQILLNLQFVLQNGQSTIASDLRNVKNECEGMRTGFAEQIDATRTDVLRVIDASQNIVNEGDSTDKLPLGVISQKITELQSAVEDVPIHHYVASWGCYHFCRAKFDLNGHAYDSVSTNLPGQGRRMSLLVALLPTVFGSLREPAVQFGLELIRKRVELDFLVEAISDGVPTKLPAWVIAFISVAQAALPTIDSFTHDSLDKMKEQKDRLDVLGELHAYSLQVGQPLMLKVGALLPTEGDHGLGSARGSNLSYAPLNIDSQDYIRAARASGDPTFLHEPFIEYLRAEGFSLASNSRWLRYHSRPSLYDLGYVDPDPFALLTIGWGRHHLVLRHPEGTSPGWRDELLNFRIY